MADTHLEPRPIAPQDPVAEALHRMKRRQRRGLIVKLLILLLAGAVGAIFYLQSAHAFQHLYLPMLSRRLGTRVTAEDGVIRLSGRAWMKNVEMMGNDGKTAFLADEMTVRVAPLSLLPGRRPVVREARLNAAQAVIRIARDGSTNWTFQPRPKRVMPTAAQAQAAPKPAAPKAAPKTAQFPQLEIMKLVVEKSMLEVSDSKGLDLTLDSLEASVDGFGRGQTGSFGLRAAGSMERPGIHQNFNAEGSGSLSQDAAGREIGWDGGLAARVSPDSQTGATSQTVTLKAALKGKMNVSGQIDQDFQLAANTTKGQAGQLAGKVNWDPEKKERQAFIKASDVGRDFLNPLLAAVGPVQLAQSRINGTCTLKGVGDVVNIDTEVTGRDLVFRIGEKKALTPAVNLDFSQRGARLDTVRQLLRVETASLTLQEGGQPVLASQLDRPVELQVGSGAAAAPAAPPARITTTLRQMPVETLQPWLILAGAASAQDLRGGVLNGQIVSEVANAGAAITVDGQVSGSGLQLPGKKDLPLDVTQTLKGRVEKMETVSIESAAMSVSSAGRKLADLDMLGRYQITPATGAATLRLAAPQAMAAARVLGLVAGDSVKLRQDGALIAGGDVTFGKEKSMVFNGTAAFRDFVFEGRGGELPLEGKAKARLTARAGRLAVEALNAEWTAATGGAPGTLTVTGEWPLDGGARGQLNFAARGVDLAPWLRLTAQEDAPAVTTMILDADETFQATDKGQSRLAGDLRIGRIEAPGADAPMTLTIKNEIARQGDQVQKLRLEAAGHLRSGANDKVVLTGNGTWSDAARELKLAGQIDSLNGDAWLPLFGFAPGDAPAKHASRKTATVAPPVDRMVASAVPMAVPAAQARPAAVAPARERRSLPMILNIAPLTIGRAQYRGCELSKARGSLRYENGASRLALDQGALAGGTITGSAEYNSARQEPAYAWEVALRQVDIPAILRVVHPKLADNFTGRGDVNSRGSGQGFGEAGKRRLQIETGFSIGNGEIRGFPFLEELAKQTKVSQFRSIQFTEFTGRTSITQGVATLKDWYEKGKEQRISLEGTVTLDGKYDLAFQPSVSKTVAGKLSQNDLARQILADQNGFMAFPFQVAVAGQGSDYQVGVRGSLNKENREQLNEGVRNLLQNVIEEKLNKQDKKKKRDKDKPGEESGAPGGNGKADDSARDEKKPSAASDHGGGSTLSVGDILNQQLQKRLDKESKKKEKKKKDKKTDKAEKADTKAGQAE